GGDIDARKHDFTIPVASEAPYLGNNVFDRKRSRIPAAERNNAERAAMIASILHLDECARPSFDAVDRVRSHRFDRHNVRYGDLVGRNPGSGVEFFLVADNAVDLRHGGKIRSLCLGSTPGHDNALVRLFALEAADCLPRLAHCLTGDSTGVDDSGLIETGRSRFAPDCFRFIGVQATTECDDVNAHDTLALVKSAGSK